MDRRFEFLSLKAASKRLRSGEALGAVARELRVPARLLGDWCAAYVALPKHPTLSVMVNDVAVRTFLLRPGATVLGRNEHCDIVITDHADEISRRHCRITAGRNGVSVSDLGSANGTFVMDRGEWSEEKQDVYNDVLLREGDSILLGNALVLRFGLRAKGSVEVPLGKLAIVAPVLATKH